MVPRPLVTARRNGVTWNPERKAHVVPRFAKAGEAAPRSFIASGAKGRQAFGSGSKSASLRDTSAFRALCVVGRPRRGRGRFEPGPARSASTPYHSRFERDVIRSRLSAPPCEKVNGRLRVARAGALASLRGREVFDDPDIVLERSG